jgi:hypothetical protein
MPRVRDVRLEVGRLEEARIALAHDLRGADRREVGSSLMLALRAEGVAEGEEDEGAGEQQPDDREHHQRRLAAR